MHNYKGKLDGKLRGKIIRLTEMFFEFNECKILSDATELIDDHYEDLVFVYENYYALKSPEVRPIEEVYDDILNKEENILGYLRYISDRWKCGMRILFVLHLVGYKHSHDLFEHMKIKCEAKAKGMEYELVRKITPFF